MKRFSKLIGFFIVFIAVIAAFCTVSFAASVGERLTSPEEGWKRYDNTNTLIKKDGTISTSLAGGLYGGSEYVTRDTNASYSFKFYGTKLRIISSKNYDRATTLITVDGNQYEYSEYISSVVTQVLQFEIDNLPLQGHNVSIKKKSSENYIVALDAIDIDSAGYIMDYNTPMNLVARPEKNEVILTWDGVLDSTSYNIKRSETLGGPYTTIATTSAITYTDTNLTNDTTYYYVVTAVMSGVESGISNEVSATLKSSNVLKLVLEVNEQKQLSISEDISDNTEMEWVSADPSIATVDINGNVKAVKPGNTLITCTSIDKSYTESINVLVVELEYQLAVDLNVGSKCRLTVNDLAGASDVTWTSYDPTVAIVNAKGKVTAKGEGLAFIFATDADGKEVGRIYIRVRQ